MTDDEQTAMVARYLSRSAEVDHWYPQHWWQAIGLPGTRCHARVEPNPSGYWGRCDLRPHPPEVDHALERGALVLRWSSRFIP